MQYRQQNLDTSSYCLGKSQTIVLRASEATEVPQPQRALRHTIAQESLDAFYHRQVSSYHLFYRLRNLQSLTTARKLPFVIPQFKRVLYYPPQIKARPAASYYSLGEPWATKLQHSRATSNLITLQESSPPAMILQFKKALNHCKTVHTNSDIS